MFFLMNINICTDMICKAVFANINARNNVIIDSLFPISNKERRSAIVRFVGNRIRFLAHVFQRTFKCSYCKCLSLSQVFWNKYYSEIKEQIKSLTIYV